MSLLKTLLKISPIGAVLVLFGYTKATDVIFGPGGGDGGNGGGSGEGDGGTVIELPIDIEVPSFWDYLAEYLSDPLVLMCIVTVIIGVGMWARSRRKKLAEEIRRDM